MDQKTLSALAVMLGLLFVILLVMAFNSYSFDEQTVALVQARHKALNGPEFVDLHKKVATDLETHHGIVAAYASAEPFKKKLEAADKLWAEAKKASKESVEIVNANDLERKQRLEELLLEVGTKMKRAEDLLNELDQDIMEEVKNYEALQRRFRNAKKGLENPKYFQLVDKIRQDLKVERAFLENYNPNPTWLDQVAAQEKVWRQARKELEETEAVGTANPKAIEQFAQKVAHVEKLESTVLADLKRISGEMKALLKARDERPAMVKNGRLAHQEIGVDKASLLTQLDQALTDFPEVKDFVAKAKKSLTSLETNGDLAWARLSAENARFEKGEVVDFMVISRSSKELQRLAKEHTLQLKQLSSRIGELYVSWDEILHDMTIQEQGGQLKFFFDIKTVRVDKDNKATESHELRAVSESEYKKNDMNLGMVLVSKPKGKFNSEAIRTPSPPGYSAVGNPYYGKWAEGETSTKKIWHWHKRHKPFVLLIYNRAPRVPFVYMSHYRGYVSARGMGRPYYGGGRMGGMYYGSRGSWNKVAYAHSSYYRRSYGYSSYMSRYRARRQPVRSTRSSSYRSSGYRSSGRRSSGYRSSRSRGSSYRGSGYRSSSTRSSSGYRSSSSRSSSGYRSSGYRRSSSYRKSSYKRPSSSYRRSSYSSSRSRSRSWGGSRRRGK